MEGKNVLASIMGSVPVIEEGEKGEKGDKGDTGESPLMITFEPASLVFNADEKGVISESEELNHWAEIKVAKGDIVYESAQKHSGSSYEYAIASLVGVNCEKGRFHMRDGKEEVGVLNISTVTIDKENGIKIPVSAGGVKVEIQIDGKLYNAFLPFSVNINSFASSLIRDNKEFQQKYTAIKNEMDSKTSLAQVQSLINQKAELINLEVSKKVYRRLNLLVNSSFRNRDAVAISPLAKIEKNTGVDGVNCLHITDKYSGSGDGEYNGAYWDGSQGSSSIPVKKGKDYTISCWIKADNVKIPFFIETFYTQKQTNTDREQSTRKYKEFHVAKINTWERIEFTITADGDYPYLAVCVWCNCKTVGTGVMVESYICKPMMEESSEYSGWYLSESDYDYVGGNLLDNTRHLVPGDNLIQSNGIEDNVYEGVCAISRIKNDTTELIEAAKWNLQGKLSVGQDYILSFLAKGMGQLNAYMYKDGAVLSIFTEASDGALIKRSSDGCVELTVSGEWKRYWVHYRINDDSPSLPEFILLRVPVGNDIYICKPMMEEGATMTDWTERKTDLVDKSTLKKAGINITSDCVELYGNQVKVSAKKGGEPSALFEGDKVSAKHIDAQSVVAEALKAGKIEAGEAIVNNLKVTNAEVSGKVSATSGYVGNFTIADGAIKYTSATKTCEVCTNYVLYVDASKKQSLYFGYGDSGVKAELTAKDSDDKDMTCAMVSGEDDVGKNKIVAFTTAMTGYTSKLTPYELKLGDYFNTYVQIRVANDVSNFGTSRISLPTIGIKCIVDKKASTLYLALAGIPSGRPSRAINGMIYEENGVLKIYKK